MADRIAIPTEQVAASTTETLEGVREVAAHIDMSLLGMFMQADFVVKSVLILLMLASFWSWAIIFDKWQYVYVIKKRMRKFEEHIWRESLDARYERAQQHADHPLARVLVAGMDAWQMLKANGLVRRATESFATTSSPHASRAVEQVHDRMARSMDQARNREISVLESHLGFLATVGSAAPFIGLFGTVWGIMNSFQSIAMTKNTTLAVVAPGIAEALFATAVGLFAAIPAVIFYNKFANAITDISDQIDDFSETLLMQKMRELEPDGESPRIAGGPM